MSLSSDHPTRGLERLVVVWRVTEHCNLSCPFCAYDRRLTRPRASADPGELRRIGRVLAEFQAQTGQPVLVSWLGGEPLLWEPLRDVTQEYVQDFGLRVSTTTNGTTLRSARVREHLIRSYAELTVSIDGLPEFHDALRGRRGLFAEVKDACRELVDEKRKAAAPLLLRANTVLMRQTVQTWPGLLDELASWSFDEISFNQLGGNDRPEFYPDHSLLPSQAEELIRAFPAQRERLQARNVQLCGSRGYLQRFAATAERRPIAIADCHPGERFLFIDQTGALSPCSFTSADYGLGTQAVSDWKHLQQLPLWFAEARAARRSRWCDDCHSTHVFAKFAD